VHLLPKQASGHDRPAPAILANVGLAPSIWSWYDYLRLNVDAGLNAFGLMAVCCLLRGEAHAGQQRPTGAFGAPVGRQSGYRCEESLNETKLCELLGFQELYIRHTNGLLQDFIILSFFSSSATRSLLFSSTT
jgi:hypothetical protein